jgi:hypothetical protein
MQQVTKVYIALVKGWGSLTEAAFGAKYGPAKDFPKAIAP